jgi:hypothetical protein
MGDHQNDYGLRTTHYGPSCGVTTRLLLSLRAEAQGAWWFSRASNPLRVAERRPGWVRFPHASAKERVLSAEASC